MRLDAALFGLGLLPLWSADCTPMMQLLLFEKPAHCPNVRLLLAHLDGRAGNLVVEQTLNQLGQSLVI